MKIKTSFITLMSKYLICSLKFYTNQKTCLFKNQFGLFSKKYKKSCKSSTFIHLDRLDMIYNCVQARNFFLKQFFTLKN